MSEKDFLDAYQEESVLRQGREMTSQEMAEQFALHGLERRIQLLKTLKTPEAMNVDEASKRWAFEGAVKRVHERLRRAGR
jgi:hypothetical protein